MNTQLISIRATSESSSVVNGLIANVLSVAIIAMTAVLTFAQLIALA